MEKIVEDYSSFSMEVIEADLRKIAQETTDKAIQAGIEPEFAKQLVSVAFVLAGRKFMEVNGFIEPNRREG